MVLQERIELSTSPLPRGCSTTELLQRTGRDRATAAALAQDLKSIRRGTARLNQPFCVRTRLPSLANPLTPFCFSRRGAPANMLME